MLFGITGSTLSDWLRFGRRCLNLVLYDHEDARIAIGPDVKIEMWKEAIAAKYPDLDGVYLAVDGLKLLLQQPGDDRIQNYFYNGWTNDHYVSNLFAFAPDGTIPACVLDAPGSLHDSTVADYGGLYTLLTSIFDRNGGKVVMDSAFARADYEFIIKSGQEVRFDLGEDVARQDRQATSARQFAEWGMHALQGSFPRLRDRFQYEENGERKAMLLTIVLLYNFRVNKVGINQILNTYMPALSKDANYYIENQTEE